MFKISSIPVNIKHSIIAGSVCFAAGFVICKYNTPSKITTITKTEYVDKVKIEYVEKKVDTSINMVDNKSHVSNTKNSIITTTKIHQKDGTVVEITKVDNSVKSSINQDSSAKSEVKSEISKDSVSTHEQTTSTETTKMVDNSQKKSVFDFGGGLSYKGDSSDLINGRSVMSYKDGGVSAEIRAWGFGLQAQAFGDGTVIGTIKHWF
jgi:hypothetical protein